MKNQDKKRAPMMRESIPNPSTEFILGRLCYFWDAGACSEPAGWYRDQAARLERVAWEEGWARESVVLIAAALSPRVNWDWLLDKLPAYLRGDYAGFLGASLDRAGQIPVRVRHREAVNWFADSSPKLQAFSRALLGDADSVTVDLWTAKACGLYPDRLTPNRIGRAQEAHRVLGRAVGVEARDVQARIWTFLRSFPSRLDTVCPTV